jgi:hypothetical protein
MNTFYSVGGRSEKFYVGESVEFKQIQSDSKMKVKSKFNQGEIFMHDIQAGFAGECESGRFYCYLS